MTDASHMPEPPVTPAVGGGPSIGQVSQIWRHPVSSFAGERVPSAMLTQTGLTGDRVGAYHERDSGQIVFPSVVRRWNLAPRIAARTDGLGQIEVSIDDTTWEAIGSPALDARLTEFCGTPIAFRPYDAATRQRYDFSPVHLISRQALTALQALLPNSQIDLRRFRPNLVVDLPGLDGRCPEYRLIGNSFALGGATLRGIRASGRCSFTTLAQRGLPKDREVLRALIDHFDKDFGIYCEVLHPGPVTEGDALVLAEPERPIVILGAGHAGAQVARHLRELGSTQPIQILGDEPHPPYERPPLSKVDDENLSPVLPKDRYNNNAIDLRLSTRITSIDRTARSVTGEDGTVFPYDRLVLATGGRARALSGVEPHPRVHLLRTADDAAHLRQRLVAGQQLAIIGTGWLGLELAATARRRGCEVTLFGRSDRVLAGSVPEAVSRFVETRHRAEGVDLRLGQQTRLSAPEDNLVEITSDAGAEAFDAVVLAIGIAPNDDLARAAGLDTEDGILVDARGMTSDPAILAAGDVAHLRGQGRIESWHAANDQAMIVARRLMHLPADPPPVTRFWSTQYDMTLQIVGQPDPAARPKAVSEGIAPLWEFDGFVIGINRPRDIRKAMARMTTGTPASDAPAPPSAPAPVLTNRHALGPVAAFAGKGPYRVDVPGLGPIVVVCIEGRFRAADDRCPHAEASLSEGFVEEGRIVCPVHFAEFDLTDGTPSNAPPGCDRLRCHPIHEQDGTLFVLF